LNIHGRRKGWWIKVDDYVISFHHAVQPFLLHAKLRPTWQLDQWHCAAVKKGTSKPAASATFFILRYRWTPQSEVTPRPELVQSYNVRAFI